MVALAISVGETFHREDGCGLGSPITVGLDVACGDHFPKDLHWDDEARAWAEFLTRSEARGPGDYGNAMERIERRYRLPSRLLWTLRYRPPKDMFVKIHRALKAAYEAERQRQVRLLTHELEITRLATGAAHPALASTEALVAADHA